MTDIPTPEQMAHHCAVHLDIDQGELLQREIARVCNRYRMTLATQLMAFAGILAEIDRQAPTQGLVAPAMTLLIRDQLRAMAILEAAPAGRA